MKQPLYITLVAIMIATVSYSQKANADIATRTTSYETNKEKKSDQTSEKKKPSVPVSGNCTCSTQNDDSCQYDANTLVYDFISKKLKYVRDKDSIPREIKNLKKIKFKEKEKFKVLVTNINRYNYDISIVANEIKYTSNTPSLFENAFLGVNYNLPDLLLSSSKSEEGGAYNGDQDDKTDLFKKNYIELKYELDLMKDKWISTYNYCINTSINCCNENTTKLSLVKFNKLLLDTKLSYIDVILIIDKKINESNEKLNELKSKIEETSLKIEKIKKEGKDSKEEEDYLKEYEYDKSKLDKKIKEFTSNKKNVESIGESLEEISEEKILRLLFHGNNYVRNHFFYQSPPIYPSGNSLKVGIKITPRDSSLAVIWNSFPLEKDSMGIDEIPITRLFNFSFSSGPFTGIRKKLTREEYYWKVSPGDDSDADADTRTHELTQLGKSSNPIGFCALANGILNITPALGAGASIGVGVTIENRPRIAYLIGGSVKIGQKQIFNVTAGLALMRSDEVPFEAYKDKKFKKDPPAIEYRHRNIGGGFVSISYSLLNLAESRLFRSN